MGKPKSIERRIETLAIIKFVHETLNSGRDLNDQRMNIRDALLRAERDLADAPLPPDTLREIGDLAAIVERKRASLAEQTEKAIASFAPAAQAPDTPSTTIGEGS